MSEKFDIDAAKDALRFQGSVQTLAEQLALAIEEVERLRACLLVMDASLRSGARTVRRPKRGRAISTMLLRIADAALAACDEKAT
jgi:uncharacterized small protein (DUF1192 family)